MTTMIEKCAKAAMDDIKRQLDGQPIPGSADALSWSATGQSINMDQVAAAVIDALMEPTEAMVDEARAAFSGFHTDYEEVGSRLAEVYAAMLSKAKSE